MANNILHATIMQKNTGGGKNIIYPKTVTKNIIDGSSTLDQTLNILKSPDVSNKTTTFTEADTRQNLVSGETLATSQGKIMKLISDLKSLAYTDTVGVSNLDSALTTAYNNRVTTDKITTSTTITSDGYVADARAVNTLQNQINIVNSNIDDKASGNFKKFGLSTSGWYRFAIYDSSRTVEAQGSAANSTMFNIKQTFNYCNNLSIFGVLNSSYMKSNISILGESVSNQTISKIRHTVDTVNNKAYLEFYYNTDSGNRVSCEVIGTKDGYTKWYVLDELVPTSESVDGVDVYSIANLTSKDRNVVTNSDLQWTYYADIAFNTETSLPTSFNELNVYVYINKYWHVFNINRQMLSESYTPFLNGSYWVSTNNYGIRVDVSTKYIKLVNSMYNSSNLTNATMKVFYR